jgi:hypothetical protein
MNTKGKCSIVLKWHDPHVIVNFVAVLSASGGKEFP